MVGRSFGRGRHPWQSHPVRRSQPAGAGGSVPENSVSGMMGKPLTVRVRVRCVTRRAWARTPAVAVRACPNSASYPRATAPRVLRYVPCPWTAQARQTIAARRCKRRCATAPLVPCAGSCVKLLRPEHNFWARVGRFVTGQPYAVRAITAFHARHFRQRLYKLSTHDHFPFTVNARTLCPCIYSKAQATCTDLDSYTWPAWLAASFGNDCLPYPRHAVTGCVYVQLVSYG